MPFSLPSHRRHGFALVSGALLAAWPLLFSLNLLTPVYCVRLGINHHVLWSPNKGRICYEAVKVTGLVDSPDSPVGSMEPTGTFRLYSALRSLVSIHNRAGVLIRHGLKNSHTASLIVAPWNPSGSGVKRLFRMFTSRKATPCTPGAGRRSTA